MRREVVTRPTIKESRILIDYAKRHVRAYRKPDEGGGRELLGAPPLAPAPQRARTIDVPAITLSAEEWAAKTRVTPAPEG